MLKILLHYGFHFALCPLIGYLIWQKQEKGKKAFIIMLLSNLVDIDHILSEPIFQANRLSVGFHLLHSYTMIALYCLLLFIPYKKLNLWWGFRPLALGLTLHMLTDLLDYYIF